MAVGRILVNVCHFGPGGPGRMRYGGAGIMRYEPQLRCWLHLCSFPDAALLLRTSRSNAVVMGNAAAVDEALLLFVDVCVCEDEYQLYECDIASGECVEVVCPDGGALEMQVYCKTGGTVYLYDDEQGDIFKYDLASRSWVTLKRIWLDGRRYYGPVLGACCGKLIVFPHHWSTAVYQYDPLSQAWCQLASTPNSVRSVKETSGGPLIVDCGRVWLEAHHDIAYEYDPPTNTWKPPTSTCQPQGFKMRYGDLFSV
jgi:hypothetical protein